MMATLVINGSYDEGTSNTVFLIGGIDGATFVIDGKSSNNNFTAKLCVSDGEILIRFQENFVFFIKLLPDALWSFFCLTSNHRYP